MRRKTSVLAALVVAAMSAVVGLSPAAAQADASPPTSKQFAAMTRIGVDRAVAEANGFEVRLDSNGVEYPVKKGSVSTSNIVTGECGTSWVWLQAVDKTKHYTTIVTGFQLANGMAGAVYINWKVSVVDNYGSSTKSWNDPAASEHFWQKGVGFTAGGPTVVYADVLYGSIATLWDGTICYSHGPSASAAV